MKKRYSIPSLTVVTMDCADIITNSTNDYPTYGGKSKGGSAEAPRRSGGIWDEE